LFHCPPHNFPPVSSDPVPFLNPSGIGPLKQPLPRSPFSDCTPSVSSPYMFQGTAFPTFPVLFRGPPLLLIGDLPSARPFPFLNFFYGLLVSDASLLSKFPTSFCPFPRTSCSSSHFIPPRDFQRHDHFLPVDWVGLAFLFFCPAFALPKRRLSAQTLRIPL